MALSNKRVVEHAGNQRAELSIEDKPDGGYLVRGVLRPIGPHRRPWFTWLDVPAGADEAAIRAVVDEVYRRLVEADVTHLRVGPSMEVAPCGARGAHLRFALSVNTATCQKCVEVRSAHQKKGRRLARRAA